MKKTSDNLHSPISHQLSLKDMVKGFKRWKESTSTFPFKRHLRHYKSFIVPDGQNKNSEHSSFNNNILQMVNTIINTSIESTYPLKRWLILRIVMVGNISDTLSINKLCVMYIYKLYCNCLLNSFLAKNNYSIY